MDKLCMECGISVCLCTENFNLALFLHRLLFEFRGHYKHVKALEHVGRYALNVKLG